MSFRLFVRSAETVARARGIRLSMAKLRDAIAKAIYNRHFSACLAAESAGNLPAVALPPPHLEAVATEYAIDLASFRMVFPQAQAVPKHEPDEFDRRVARLEQIKAKPPITPRAQKSTIAAYIGSKRGRYWEPTLPLQRPDELGRMRAYKDKVTELASVLGEAAVPAVNAIMLETATSLSWELLAHEAVFLQALRRYVATCQGPISREQLEVLIQVGQLVSRRDEAGQLWPTLTLVQLPLTSDCDVPVLYDVLLDGVDVGAVAIPEDSRSEEAMAPALRQSDISNEQRARARVDERTLTLVNDTVTILWADLRDDRQLLTAREVVQRGRDEGEVRGRWSAHESTDRNRDGAHQSLMMESSDRGGQGAGIGGPFQANALGKDVFDLLSKHPINMSRREHETYFYVWGFDACWATNTVAHIRLASRIPARKELPACSPMAGSVRVGSTWAPAIVIAFDDESADALVIAPAMLHGTRRMIVPRNAVREGEQAFGKAIRAKAKLLDYALDDPGGVDLPIANSFHEARMLWPATGHTQAVKPVTSAPKAHWDGTRAQVLANPAAYLQDCLSLLASAPFDASGLSQHLADEDRDLWEEDTQIERTLDNVRLTPLVPAAWFQNLTSLARLAHRADPGKSTAYPAVLTAAMAQIQQAVSLANRCRMDDAYYSLLNSAGTILDDAASEGFLDRVPALANSLLGCGGRWRKMSPRYYDEPYGFDYEALLNIWLAVADAASGNLKPALRRLSRLRRTHPKSVDIRVLELAVQAAVDPTSARAYVEVACREDAESLGFFRDMVRDHAKDVEQDIEVRPASLVDCVAYGLHVPCAVPHAVVAGIRPEIQRALVNGYLSRA